MLHRSKHLTIHILVAMIASCSPNPSSTKNFTDANEWFSLSIPDAWQHELEEEVHTFTNPTNPQWAFQISAYRAMADTVSAFNVTAELQRERPTHPNARIVTLGNRQLVYYTQLREGDVIYCWIVGGKRCKAFCTFTTDTNKEDDSLGAAMKAIASMTLE
jgi:hypothetical protein